jgi:hypothetical protein
MLLDRAHIDSGHTGTVIGFYDDYALLHLDEGFYNADKTVFISILLVHRDNLTKE